MQDLDGDPAAEGGRGSPTAPWTLGMALGQLMVDDVLPLDLDVIPAVSAANAEDAAAVLAGLGILLSISVLALIYCTLVVLPAMIDLRERRVGAELPGYDASDWVCDGATPEAGGFVLDLATTAVCTITNNDIARPALDVTKIVDQSTVIARSVAEVTLGPVFIEVQKQVAAAVVQLTATTNIFSRLWA